MTNALAQNENSTRIFRENPFGWYDKVAMRYLRKKYGEDKKTFLIIRAVYLALTEIDSDFNGSSIPFFTETVGTYAGVSREVAGKYLNILEEEGLIQRTRKRDPQTKKFLGGTDVHILSVNSQHPSSDSEEAKPIGEKEPLSGYPSTGLPQRWDTQANNKKIKSSQENKSNVNEFFKAPDDKKRSDMQGVREIMKRFDTFKPTSKPSPRRKDTSDTIIKRDYLAQEIADVLRDQKSLGAFRRIAEHVPEMIIRDYLASIKETWKEGKIKKSRGALFMSMIQQYTDKQHIQLGFKTGGDEDQ